MVAVLAALLVGCGLRPAPGGEAPPAGTASGRLTVSVRLAIDDGRGIQALVRRWGHADIDHVALAVLTVTPQPGTDPGQWPEQAVLTEAGQAVAARIDRADLAEDIVFGNLAPYGQYRFRARAFEDGGALISTAASFLDYTAVPPGDERIPLIPVILADTVFSGAAEDNPIVVEDGQVLTGEAGSGLFGFLVETVAGNGRGFADGPAEEALFDGSMGLAARGDGTLIVADTGNHGIRQIAPDGAVTTLAGGSSGLGALSTLAGGSSSLGSSAARGASGFVDGATSDARFNAPRSVAWQGDTIVVADTGNNAIRRIRPADGIVETVAGSRYPGTSDGMGEAAGFWHPGAVAIDPYGQIVVADTDNHCLRKIDPQGAVWTYAGVCGTAGFADGTAGRFDRPAGLAVDPRDGSVLVADSGNHAIRRISLAGEVETLAGDGQFGNANGQGSAARFDEPAGIALDTIGNILVADTGNHLVRLVTPDRQVRTVAGSIFEGNADGTGGDAEFSAPAGLAYAGGIWWLCDTGNHRVRRLSGR